MAACTESREEAVYRLVKEWTRKEIKFPERSVFTVQGKDTVDFTFHEADYKVLVYVDSVGCTSCKLQLDRWKKLIEKMTEETGSVTGHVLELWDYNNDSLVLYKRILLSPYSYDYKGGQHWAAAKAENDVEKGVERICCSDKYIYMLYNPNTHEMIAEKKDNHNSEIWVFDWNGVPVTKMNVNQKIECFCVDESESKIYCIMNAPDPSIGCFKNEVL